MEEKKKKKKSKTDWLGSIGLTLILTAVALLIWFFLRGETVVTGEYEGGTGSNSMSCVVEGYKYPFFEYDNANGKKTEVNIIFNGNEVRSISLIQYMYYVDNKTAVASEAANHADMNISFGKELGHDALGANYSVYDNIMRMSLFANGDELNARTRKYFLLGDSYDNIDEYSKNYANKGFNCVVKNNEV